MATSETKVQDVDNGKINNTTTEQNPADSVVQVNEPKPVETQEAVNPINDTFKQLTNADQASTTTKSIVSKVQASIPDVKVDTINHIDTTYLRDLTDKINEQARQQIQNDYDYTVQSGVTQLQRTNEDAQQGYRENMSQIEREANRALDNQALYNRSRGDNGGVGQAQYNSIQNTAAVNKQAVRSEQQKLANDVRRQVADLRASGKFQMADKLLELSQNYLSQLKEIEQYSQQMNLSIDQFNAQLKEWEANFKLQASQYLTSTELNAAEMTGYFGDGTPTAKTTQQAQQQLAQMGQALFEAGVTPSASMIAAMGLDPDTFKFYWQKKNPNGTVTQEWADKWGINAGAQSSGGGSGGGGGWLTGSAEGDYALLNATDSAGNNVGHEAVNNYRASIGLPAYEW